MELFFLALLMLIMAVALGSGYPVAFALPGAAIITITLAAAAGYLFVDNVDAFFHSGGPSQWLTAGVTNLRGVYWEVERDTLIAIPLFIFMGIMLQKSKIAEDLLVTMAQLFGPVPGGLGVSVVFVGALLAATTGIVGATVVAMGLISLPAMLRNNYSRPLATGTIAASGTLGQIIPPSIVLIILADQLASASDQASTARKALHREVTGELSMPSVFDVVSTSAGEMFLGAFVPGLLLVLFYMIFILVFALIRPSVAPAVPYEGTRDVRFWVRVLLTLVPPLTLIFLVLGSILTGVATVNQAGAIGAAGALIMAGYRLTGNRSGTYYPAVLAIVGLALIVFSLANYEMNIKSLLTSGGSLTGIWIGGAAVTMVLTALVWSGVRVFRIENTMHEVMVETAKTTSLVFIILLGAAMLTAAFRAFGGEDLVRNFLQSLPGGFWTQFAIVMAVIFVLGFFLDFIEIAVVVVPIVAPILLADPAANITAVWLGVMIGLNIQTSFLTPPFGFALFYLRGVAPASVRTTQIYRGVVAFIALQLAALGVVGYFPQLVNYVPNRVGLMSDNAPPPRNPKLQLCLESYVHEQLATSADTVRTAISTAHRLDLSALPDKVASGLTEAFGSADSALEMINVVFTAEAEVRAAAPAYRPQLATVRGLQADLRRLEKEMDKLRKSVQLRNSQENSGRQARIERKIADLETEHAHITGSIPESWNDTFEAFQTLVTTENSARNAFRRAADNAVESPRAFLAIIRANAAFDKLENRLKSLGTVIGDSDPESAENLLKQVGGEFGTVAGAGDISSAIGKARRAMRGDNPDREKAMAELNRAIEAFEAQRVWRNSAEKSVKPGVEAYLVAISDTVGARRQPRLTRNQALYIAACNADHRDLSLSF